MGNNPFSLEGKTILVTGASSGIGKATSIECSQLGATVIISGRNQQRLQETFDLLEGSDCHHQMIVADLTNPENIQMMLEKMPQIDGVVLCAGKGLTLPVQFSTPEHFSDIFDVNFFSPIELLRLLYKKKHINKNGSVVLLSSLGGVGLFGGCNSIYGASKSALNSMMKFCAKEFASRGIRVNSICPAMVETPFIHRGTISDDQLKQDVDRYPLKRYGTPHDIAYMAIYLLSNASTWVTGQAFVIDGGRSLN